MQLKINDRESSIVFYQCDIPCVHQVMKNRIKSFKVFYDVCQNAIKYFHYY